MKHGYRIENYVVNRNPNGVDCFGDLFEGEIKLGDVIYYGSQGAGPYVTFQTRDTRDAFEKIAGRGLDYEAFIHTLFDEVESRYDKPTSEPSSSKLGELQIGEEVSHREDLEYTFTGRVEGREEDNRSYYVRWLDEPVESDATGWYSRGDLVSKSDTTNP